MKNNNKEGDGRGRMFSHAALKAEPDVTMAACRAAEVAPCCDRSTCNSTNEKLPQGRLKSLYFYMKVPLLRLQFRP